MQFVPPRDDGVLRTAASAVLALLLCVCASTPLIAQTGAIEGSVAAAEGEPLAGATIDLRLPGAAVPLRVVASARDGGFQIVALPPASYRLTASFLGRRSVSRDVDVGAGETVRLALVLEEEAVAVEGLVVTGDRQRERFREEAGVTVRELSGAELRLIPGLAESDVLRALEVLPGVVSTSDFSAAFNVRGGSADQNLILLDGIPIYNPFHLGGLFSVFNPDMVGGAELFSGGFPARFGGRVSSVVRIRSEMGDADDARTRAGVSVLATRLTTQVPVPDAWSSRIGLRDARVAVGGRRSYFDKLLGPFVEFPYHLTDFQGRIEAWAGPGRLGVTGYSGRDVLDLGQIDPEDFPLRIRWRWGNDVIGGSWNAVTAPGTAVEVRGGYSRFQNDIAFPDFEDTRFRSLIEQTFGAVDYARALGGGVGVEVGGELQHSRYDNVAETGGTRFGGASMSGTGTAAYAQAEWTPSRRWRVELGARADAWLPDGGEAMGGVAPRFALKRFLPGDGALKVAAGRYSQFVHSVRDEEVPVGIDIWVLSGPRAPRVVSDQIQIGYERYLPKGWYAAVESFHRSFDGVITNNAADDPNDDRDDLVAGDGAAYGADLIIRRDTGRVRGFVSASWLKATRSFPDVTSGMDPQPTITYPPIFDRRLDLDLVLSARLGRGILGGMRFNYGSGLPYTKPRAAYVLYEYDLITGGRNPLVSVEDTTTALNAIALGPRNAQRYPAYHRLDVSIRKPIRRSWGRLTPYLEVLNLYNRRNVLFWFFEYDRDPPVRSGISMFPVLPTLGLEVEF